MNTTQGLLSWLMLAMMTSCSNVPVANTSPTELVILQSWSGDYRVAELKRLPAGQQQTSVGYLGNAAAFWAAFKPGEAAPEVDFGKHVVVFHRKVDIYNRTRIFKVTHRDGGGGRAGHGNPAAIPIMDQVSMALAVIPRASVKSLRSGTASVPVRAE